MRWARLGVLAVATLAVLHGAGWLYATSRLEQEVAAGLDGLRVQGWVIEAPSPQRAGYPFSASARFGPVLVDGTGAGVPVAWSAEGVTFAISAARPGTLHVLPSPKQRWRLGGADWVPVEADAFEVQADTTGLTLAGRNVAVRLPDGPLRIGKVQARAEGLGLRVDLTGVDLTGVDLTGVALPAPVPPLAHLALDAALTQAVPGLPDPAAAAAAWRDGGGTVQVRNLAAEAGELAVTASGTVRLDAALQPVLDLQARIRGYRPALDRLVQAGAMTASAATATRAVLGLLASREADGAAMVPIRLADGTVAAAGYPLLRVPGVDWGAAGRR